MATTQRCIRAVNCQAIALWMTDSVAWSPPGVDLGCLRLDENARVRLASMPVLLIDLAFDDSSLWSQLIARHVSDAGATECVGSNELSQPLVRQVLVMLWHLAQLRDRVGVRLIDPSLTTTTRLADLDVCALEQLYEPATSLLGARWSYHHDYWQGLVDAACQGDPQQLERMFLVGLQMLGVPAHAPFIA